MRGYLRVRPLFLERTVEGVLISGVDRPESFRLHRFQNASKMRFGRDEIYSTADILILMTRFIEISHHAADGSPCE